MGCISLKLYGMFKRKRVLGNPVAIKKLGKRIADYRDRLGITQDELASRAGIERSYMGTIERGERNPSYDKLVSIAKVLGVSIKDLV